MQTHTQQREVNNACSCFLFKLCTNCFLYQSTNIWQKQKLEQFESLLVITAGWLWPVSITSFLDPQIKTTIALSHFVAAVIQNKINQTCNHLCAQTHTYMRKSPWMAYDFILKTFCPNQILKLGVLRCPPVAIPDTAQGMPWKKNKCLIQHNLMLFSSILLKLKEQQIGKFESKYYRIRVIMFIWNAFIFQFL